MLTDKEKEFIELIRLLNDEDKELIKKRIDELLDKQK